MPQRASVFCNFYIRVDREAFVSERALDVGSVAFKAMSTKTLKRHSRCFDIMKGHGNFAFNLVVKLSVELGYVFLSLRL
jgi:hypothetical protein